MEITGKWNSTKYPGITGTIKFIFTHEFDKNSSVVCDCIMEYDDNSSFSPGKINEYKLECAYTDKALDGEHRIVARDIDFNVKQYFTFTFGSKDLKRWSGFGACVYPCDVISLILSTKEEHKNVLIN